MSARAVEKRPDTRTADDRWRDLDRAMRAIACAVDCCQHAGLTSIAERLLVLQNEALAERRQV